MNIRLIISILFFNFFLFGQLNAHHGPDKLQSHFKNFAYLSLTKKLGPFNVNFFTTGKIPNKELTSLNNKKFELLLDDEFNLASIIMRDGEIICDMEVILVCVHEDGYKPTRLPEKIKDAFQKFQETVE